MLLIKPINEAVLWNENIIKCFKYLNTVLMYIIMDGTVKHYKTIYNCSYICSEMVAR